MNSFEYTIRDEIGIHARPAGMLIQEAKKYPCSLTIECRGKKADMKKIMLLLSLGIKCHDKVTVTAEGEGAETAIASLKEYFESNL